MIWYDYKDNGKKVKTPQGVGTIKNAEPYGYYSSGIMIGVVHDTFPYSELHRWMYRDDVIYYFEKDIEFI